MTDYCRDHLSLAVDIATIKETLLNIENKVCQHVTEGEKPGGYRDRLVRIELEVLALKKSFWGTCLIAGFLGGMIGKVAPDFMIGMLKLFGL